MEIKTIVHELRTGKEVEISSHNIDGMKGNHMVVRPCLSVTGKLENGQYPSTIARCKGETKFNRGTKQNPIIEKTRCQFRQGIGISN